MGCAVGANETASLVCAGCSGKMSRESGNKQFWLGKKDVGQEEMLQIIQSLQYDHERNV